MAADVAGVDAAFYDLVVSDGVDDGSAEPPYCCCFLEGLPVVVPLSSPPPPYLGDIEAFFGGPFLV